MRGPKSSVPEGAVGRNSFQFLQFMREWLSQQTFTPGQFMTPVRELAERHGVSRETARRVLKMLEGEGLLVSEPRHGYRVVQRSAEPRAMHSVAFILGGGELRGQFDPLYRQMLVALQEAAEQQGWSFLAVGTKDRSLSEVTSLLERSNVSGILLNTDQPDLTAAISRFGLPVVALEFWSRNLVSDRVRQDSYQGAFAAGEFLAARGHRTIGWIGPVARSSQSLERWGGAAAALRSNGLAVDDSFILDLSECGNHDSIRALLSHPNRPSALLALWSGSALAVARVADQMGLTLGADLDLVGWSPAEQYSEYAANFPHGKPAPSIVWSMRQMARVAIANLADRMMQPNREHTNTLIDADLKIPADWPAPRPGNARIPKSIL